MITIESEPESDNTVIRILKMSPRVISLSKKCENEPETHNSVMRKVGNPSVLIITIPLSEQMLLG